MYILRTKTVWSGGERGLSPLPQSEDRFLASTNLGENGGRRRWKRERKVFPFFFCWRGTGESRSRMEKFFSVLFGMKILIKCICKLFLLSTTRYVNVPRIYIFVLYMQFSQQLTTLPFFREFHPSIPLVFFSLPPSLWTPESLKNSFKVEATPSSSSSSSLPFSQIHMLLRMYCE